MWNSALLDATAYAALALAASISSSFFRLHNFAVGIVAVLGAWILLPLFDGANVAQGTANIWLIPIAVFLVVLITSPIIFTVVLRKHPLVFLLVSVGATLGISALMQGYYLPGSTAGLPVAAVGPSWIAAILAVAIACVPLAVPIFHRPFAKLVLRWRLADRKESKTWLASAPS